MKNFKIVIPYKYKKIGFILFILIPLELILSLLFKQILFLNKELVLSIMKIIGGIGTFIVIFSKEKYDDERISLYKFQSITNGFGMIILLFTLNQIFELATKFEKSDITNSPTYLIYMGVFMYFITFYTRKKDE